MCVLYGAACITNCTNVHDDRHCKWILCFCATAGRVAAALHDLEERMRQAKKEKKRLCRRARKECANQKQLWHDAFVLYVLTDCDIAAPVALMDRFGPVPHEEVRTRMENEFLEKPLGHLALYSCVDDRIEPRVKQQTEKFFREWKLARWVNKVNDEIGTTPGFSNIAEELNARAVSPEQTDDEVVPKPESIHKWIQRWRRKWKASIGRVKTQLGGNPAKLSEKADRKLCQSQT